MGLLKIISSCVSGSLRILIFIVSLSILALALAFGLIGLGSKTSYSIVGATDYVSRCNLLIALAIYLLVLSIVGFSGAVVRDHRNIIFGFFCLSAFNILLLWIALASLPDVMMIRERFEATLMEAQPNYDWSRFADSYTPKDDSPISRDPTVMWDQLQRINACCGAYERVEWQKYSPDKKSYPKSCCNDHITLTDEYQFCTEVDKRTMPCITALGLPIELFRILMGLGVAVSVSSSLLASFAIFF